MMKIKKLTLESDFGVLKKQSIEFSTDEQKPLTVIIGKNGSGKTTLVNAIKMGLSLETSLDDIKYCDRTNFDSKLVLETTSDSSFVSKENQDLFFPDMERLGRHVTENPYRLNPQQRHKLADKMNEIKNKYDPNYLHAKFSFDEDGNIHLVDEQGFDRTRNLAGWESLLVTLIWVLAAKHFVAPNSFLVLDKFLGRLSSSHRTHLIPLLFSPGNFSQIIWLVSDAEYLGRQTGLSDEPIPSLRESILEKQVLGKEYEIVDGYVVPFGGK